MPFESSQDLLHSSWRRRSWYGTHRSEEASGSVPAIAPSVRMYVDLMSSITSAGVTPFSQWDMLSKRPKYPDRVPSQVQPYAQVVRGLTSRFGIA